MNPSSVILNDSIPTNPANLAIISLDPANSNNDNNQARIRLTGAIIDYITKVAINTPTVTAELSRAAEDQSSWLNKIALVAKTATAVIPVTSFIIYNVFPTALGTNNIRIYTTVTGVVTTVAAFITSLVAEAKNKNYTKISSNLNTAFEKASSQIANPNYLFNPQTLENGLNTLLSGHGDVQIVENFDSIQSLTDNTVNTIYIAYSTDKISKTDLGIPTKSTSADVQKDKVSSIEFIADFNINGQDFTICYGKTAKARLDSLNPQNPVIDLTDIIPVEEVKTQILALQGIVTKKITMGDLDVAGNLKFTPEILAQANKATASLMTDAKAVSTASAVMAPKLVKLATDKAGIANNSLNVTVQNNHVI